jgi:hypothetical protein
LALVLPLDNFYRPSFLVAAFLVDVDGAQSDEVDAISRMVFIWGAPGVFGIGPLALDGVNITVPA